MKNITLTKIMTTASIVALTVSSQVYADKSANTGAFAFQAITESANSDNWNPIAPWKIPAGFSQSVVSDETALNIYGDGRTDWPDMNTVNETGKKAGKFLYRTHELRNPANQPEGGSISVVNLERRKYSIRKNRGKSLPRPEWHLLKYV